MPRKALNKQRKTHNYLTSVQEKLKYAIDNGDAKIEKRRLVGARDCAMLLPLVTRVINATLIRSQKQLHPNVTT